MAATTPKKPKIARELVDQNPVEAFRDLGRGIAKSVAHDVAQESINGLWDQLLGTGKYSAKKTEGDLTEGQEIDLRSLPKHQAQIEKSDYRDVDPGIDYRREILQGSETLVRRENKETEVLIQQILVEIKKLAASTKELQVEFKEVVVEQRIEKPGKYHMRFFEWVLSVLRLARMRVEDSANWLALFKSKKNQRQYWNMFKKHGTTFGLSNERVVSTQTG